MYRWIGLSLIAGLTLGCAATAPQQNDLSQAAIACDEGWYRSVEQRLGTGDGQGHGPDLGSAEWKSVVEFKLGLRGQAGVPAADTAAWCSYIEQQLQQQSSSRGPAFSCQGELSQAEAAICQDGALAALDQKLDAVYRQALHKADGRMQPVLKAEQRGWLKGRNECWKAEEPDQCIERAYRMRTAQLQAQYRLVKNFGPVRYMCNNNPADEFVATFFQTEPGTVIVERGDSVSLMYSQPSASGAKYRGRNESLWEHQGMALIRWGQGTKAMMCSHAGAVDTGQ